MRITIVAQDPGVRRNRRILTTQVDIPDESVAEGPRGSRVHVVDYDTESGTLYQPFDLNAARRRTRRDDPFRGATNATILEDPGFHAMNVYALIMRTLARFEFALGRRVAWGFRSGGHQIKVAPHAFGEANAFYSPDAEALLFGYFKGSTKKYVFSCLAHDVVVHEATHAIIDGLRERYTEPSSPDQAASHEGLSDVVALLSVFSLRDVVAALLEPSIENDPDTTTKTNRIDRSKLKKPELQDSVLLGLAEEMGSEMSAMRGGALRQSATLKPPRDLDPPQPATTYLQEPEYLEPHRRGEIFVAAMMNAFLDVWVGRLDGLKRIDGRYLESDRVTEEGAEVADYLLTMAIRALDYLPPVHVEFGDFLSAMLTADFEIRPDDRKYRFRDHLRESFALYGITPSARQGSTDGRWVRFEEGDEEVDYTRTHFESMLRDPDEVFRFFWLNRDKLDLHEDGYTRVISVRPVLRIAPDDGFPLRETVVEVLQQIKVRAGDLHRLGVGKPADMESDLEVELQGGMTAIFDEHGRLKYVISNSLPSQGEASAIRHEERLEYLFEYGHYRKGDSIVRRFSTMHTMRALGYHSYGEVW